MGCLNHSKMVCGGKKIISTTFGQFLMRFLRFLGLLWGCWELFGNSGSAPETMIFHDFSWFFMIFAWFFMSVDNFWVLPVLLYASERSWMLLDALDAPGSCVAVCSPHFQGCPPTFFKSQIQIFRKKSIFFFEKNRFFFGSKFFLCWFGHEKASKS